jgi:ribosomal-protein-alanine N-acetyltransferase
MAAMHRQAFPPHEAWDAASFAVQLSLPGGFGLIDTAGFVLLRALAGEAELLTLAVVPLARRQGHGRALLTAAKTHAAERGAEVLFLEVAEGNQAARALYTNAGAEPVGRRRNYYPNGGDALVCRIRLAPGVTDSAANP